MKMKLLLALTLLISPAVHACVFRFVNTGKTNVLITYQDADTAPEDLTKLTQVPRVLSHAQVHNALLVTPQGMSSPFGYSDKHAQFYIYTTVPGSPLYHLNYAVRQIDCSPTHQILVSRSQIDTNTYNKTLMKAVVISTPEILKK